MLKKWFRKLFGKREMLTPDEAWDRLSPAERQSIIDAACRPLDRAIERAEGGAPC